MSTGLQQARRISRELELHRRGKFQRHWRYTEAVRAHRVERRLGCYLTEKQVAALWCRDDELALRQLWLSAGGFLVVRDGRLDLSPDLPRRKQR